MFHFEEPAAKTFCPALWVKGEAAMAFFDSIGYNGSQQFEEGCKLLRNAEVVTLNGPTSTLNMINQAPEDFTSLCNAFLERNKL